MLLKREHPPLATDRLLNRSALLLFCLLSASLTAIGVPNLEKVEAAFIAGKYADVIRDAMKGVATDEREERWYELLAEANARIGDYHKAAAVIDKGIAETFPYSVRLRVLGYQIYPHAGQQSRALSMLEEINQLARMRDWAYRDATNRVALGVWALWMGGEPKKVLDLFYDPVRKAHPDYRGAWLAVGQLALDKGDFAMAGRVYGDALKRFPDDPDVLFGLARSFAGSDAEAMYNAAQQVFDSNPNHVGARLLLADYQIDAEDYAQARELLTDALKTNPHEPEAFALQSVLAHLDADEAAARKLRQRALGFWTNNPSVDFWIGRKLSQKYRFAEGAEHQRRAVAMDPEFLPAKIQLAQDLLRLGRDAEGWALAEEVSKADPYDVLAYNLVTLKDSVSGFRELRTDHFIVRMDSQEAAVYGRDVLALLDRARTNLCTKYGLDLTNRVTVEIFKDQKDFAIRTFGLPGGAGYLGVCFGNVITANSPATRLASPSNWEAILWHEFCHVVTLQLTRNRMPRWLSEGISVYEERQANASWGEHMIPTYRRMLLADDLTPVSELSEAFLRPKSGLHLQFAYYQASLVVEYLVEKHGAAVLPKILLSLRDGVSITESISRHTAPIKAVDRGFAEYAKQIANATGPKLDWASEVPKTPGLPTEFLQWYDDKPTSFAGLNEKADRLMADSKWTEAKEPLKTLIELYPEQRHEGNAYEKLAYVHRKLGETAAEREMLSHIAATRSDAQAAYLRLMEMEAAESNWASVLTNAQRLASVNPMLPSAHLFAADAAAALDDSSRTVEFLKTALLLNPPDPAALNFRIAEQLDDSEPDAARRHVLMALEEAPRFRDALELLVKLQPMPKDDSKSDVQPAPTPAPPSAKP